jgi:MFS family permease
MHPVLLRISISTLLSIVAFSMAMPSIAVATLDRHGALFAGVLTALPSLLIVLVAPLASRLSARHTPGRLYRAGQGVLILSLLLFAAGDALWIWFLASALLGTGAAFVWPITESAVADLAPVDAKGKFTGLYQTGLGLAFTIGPFLAAGLNLDERFLFLASAAVAFVAAAPALGLQLPAHPPHPDDAKPEGFFPGVARLWIAAPLLVTAALIGGFYESGSNLTGTATVLALDFVNRIALLAPGVIAAGSFVAQYPIGVLADRFGAARVLRFSLIALALSAALLPLTPQAPHLLWPLLVIWGGVGGGLYTLAMIVIAGAFRGRATLEATGLMVALYTLGGALGPAISGVILEVSPFYGAAVLFGALAFLGLFVGSTKRKPLASGGAKTVSEESEA